MMFLKFLIFIIVFYLLFRFFKKGSPKAVKDKDQGRFRKSVTGEELVEDPVCHTYIPISNALRWENKGKILYFCSQKCLEKYKSEHE
jgi:YHS domain-containing protein